MKTAAEYVADLIAAYAADFGTGYCRAMDAVETEIEEAGMTAEVRALLPQPDRSSVETIEGSASGVDQKGRRIGGFAVIRHCQPGIHGAIGFVPHGPAGFVVGIYATRNGQRYGALPHETFYLTVEECRAHAAKGLAAQAKRYAAKFAAKGEPCLACQGDEAPATPGAGLHTCGRR